MRGSQIYFTAYFEYVVFISSYIFNNKFDLFDRSVTYIESKPLTVLVGDGSWSGVCDEVSIR